MGVARAQFGAMQRVTTQHSAAQASTALSTCAACKPAVNVAAVAVTVQVIHSRDKMHTLLHASCCNRSPIVQVRNDASLACHEHMIWQEGGGGGSMYYCTNLQVLVELLAMHS